MRGDEMKMNARMSMQPPILFGLMRIKVVQNDVNLLVWIFSYYLVHKVQELPPPAARVMSRTDLAAQDLQSSEKGGRAVAFIFMAEPLQGLSAGQAQPTLGPFQHLNCRFLIHAQHRCAQRRVQIETDNIGRFAGGKGVEHWGVVDQMGMLAQLGFVEAPGQPAGAHR